MKNKTSRTLSKFGMISGIIMLICGIVILIVSLLDIEVKSVYRIGSGIFFIALGCLYMWLNSKNLNKNH